MNMADRSTEACTRSPARSPHLRARHIRSVRLFAARRVAATLLAGALTIFPPSLAAADALARQCRPPRPLRTIVLRDMGPCGFDPETLSFAGDPVQQTACLARPVGIWGRLGAPLQNVPDVLAERVGRSALLPDRAALAQMLSGLGLTDALAAGLFAPISRARNGDPFAPAARYFVIHDTSGPRMEWFPPDLDDNPRLNDLARFRCSDGFEVAHAVINRMGDIFVGHDFGVPWRATKLERAINFGTDLKGIF